MPGGPVWLDTDPWDIAAKADRPYELEDLREMFRNLLADEFGLKLRKEVKDGPVYALTVDPAGLKMQCDEEPRDYEVFHPAAVFPASADCAAGPAPCHR